MGDQPLYVLCRARQLFQWLKDTQLPDSLHYGAMIDAASKAGAIDEAMGCVESGLQAHRDECQGC